MTVTTPQLTDLYAPVADDLRRVEEIFDAELLSDVPFVNELCGRVQRYRGKMLRPALLLLIGRACGRVVQDHRVLAAVVEMVHMATLVHDDVLDEADQRRRHPTINATEGNVTAVLLGDYLISHAFHLCSSLENQYASRLIGATTNTVCEGELMQNRLRGRLDISEATYLDIIRRKTAVLTATACELGAWCSGAEDSLVSAMRSFGTEAGMAFQIADDVLDLLGTVEDVGKTLGRDADLGKCTLPAIHALAHAQGAMYNRLCALLSPGCAPRADSPNDFAPTTSCADGIGIHVDRTELADILRQTGSFEYAMQSARRFVQSALERLECLPKSDARGSLSAITEFILARRY